ncbi:MAG: NAD(P)H-dependent oxidoreductase [Thermodesulfobacteriota bacterium]
MKIAVLSGSPKGKNSVSLQSVKYLEKKFSTHEFNYFQISQSIKKLESDPDEFENLINEIKEVDMVIWVSPVYTLLVPAQLKRFIELIFERKKEAFFKDKFCGVLTTSISFFDNCAHNYLRGISEDLEMKFCGSFSADSYDLLDDTQRETLIKFGKILFENAENNMPLQKIYSQPDSSKTEFKPEPVKEQTDFKNKKILLIKDRSYKGENLEKMTETFLSSVSSDVEQINLSELDIKGGCTGCVQCGFDHHCMYEGVDEFIDFFDNKVRNSDIIIMAGEIKDRWLSSKWKQFFDRSFFHNHIPMMMNKQIGFIISGRLSLHSNLQNILESFIQWQRANLCDIVSDEFPEYTADNIINLAKRLKTASENEYVAPIGFPGKGGHKIFRDDIYARHRFVFQKDHKWYEENGFYDFPQHDEKALEMSENMIKLTKDPEAREAVRKMLKKEMVKPHMKIVENAE